MTPLRLTVPAHRERTLSANYTTIFEFDLCRLYGIVVHCQVLLKQAKAIYKYIVRW